MLMKERRGAELFFNTIAAAAIGVVGAVVGSPAPRSKQNEGKVANPVEAWCPHLTSHTVLSHPQRAVQPWPAFAEHTVIRLFRSPLLCFLRGPGDREPDRWPERIVPGRVWKDPRSPMS